MDLILDINDCFLFIILYIIIILLCIQRDTIIHITEVVIMVSLLVFTLQIIKVRLHFNFELFAVLYYSCCIRTQGFASCLCDLLSRFSHSLCFLYFL